MPRKLRIQFAGAIYHVINRGNYRRDVFEDAGAAKAFVATLDEACERHHWRLHAYVVMRNHFHLVITTPEPNLVDGMHWLQSTFATRFNRLRKERGHLFQGRYQSLLIEDAAALARVVDYVHLNPVRSGIVSSTMVAAFRWSSLARLSRADRPTWLSPGEWLSARGDVDTPSTWARYVFWLQELAMDTVRQEREGFKTFSRGWAIGTAAWRKAIAKEHAHLALQPGLPAAEIRELREAQWVSSLSRLVAELEAENKNARFEQHPKGAEWKIAAASRLRRECGASHAWIARELSMGSANSVRSYLSRKATMDQQTSA